MSRAALLVVLCGCKQLLGLDEASSPLDAPVVAIDMTVDQPVDMPVEAGAPVTVTFRNGDGGYAGTIDTTLDAGNPNAINGGDAQLTVRKPDRSTLLAFTGLFGTAVGQIPSGATITSASLDLVVQQVNSTGTIYEVLAAWTEDTTFNTFGPDPGINNNTDFGDAVALFEPTMSGPVTFEVTATVAKWSAGTIPNNGWIINGEGGGGGDSKVRSSEDLTVANRPTLHVTFVAP